MAAAPAERFYPSSGWTPFTIKSGVMVVHRTRPFTVLALNLKAKEVPGLYLLESEGANFWLSVLSDLQNRGVEDIL